MAREPPRPGRRFELDRLQLTSKLQVGTQPQEYGAKTVQFGENSSTAWQSFSSSAPQQSTSVSSLPQQNISAGSLRSLATLARQGISNTSLAIPRARPLEGHGKIISSVRLLRAELLEEPATPLPRCQDLPEPSFGEPGANSSIVSVSHAWRNQAHPDPTGRKMQALSRALQLVPRPLGGGANLVFLDFVSVPQRAFLQGQAERTPTEAVKFKSAIRCMHEMYFYSDYVVHLPWEEIELEGEGEEVIVPASCLKGESFATVRDQVQLSSDVKSLQLRAFDVVECLNGDEITKADQLRELLAKGVEGTATIRRYPFGLPNLTPADDRGWVFLERFITMVKCAMMDEAAARRAVITTSEALLQQIMGGAERLREAAKRSKQSKKGEDELREVLESFLQELQAKRFSAASVDKQQTEESAKLRALASDKEVVMGIMREFVEHLGENWSEEAALQKSMASRAAACAQSAKQFLVKWYVFSEEYTEEFEEAAASTSVLQVLVPLLKILLAPILVLALLLAPVEDPDTEITQQFVWWGFVWPGACYAIYCILPLKFYSIYGVPITRWRLGCIAVLGLGTVVNTQIVMLLLGKLWVWPLPWATVMGTCPSLLAYVPLWWTFSRSERSSSEFRWKLVHALLHYTAVLVMFISIFPLLNALLPKVSEPVQALLLFSYLLGKIVMEAAGSMLSRRMGADMMPSLVWDMVLCYEINVCVSFMEVSNPFVVVIQTCFNLLENAYHVYSLVKVSLSKREEQCLVSMLVTREFAELIVPLQFLAIFLAIQHVRPKNSNLTCMRSEADVQRTILYVLVSVCMQLSVSLITALWLKCRGHRPFALLRGLLATRPFYWRMTATVWVGFMVGHHSHLGSDVSMRFLWLQEGAEWVCGNVWRLPGAA